MSLAKQLNGVEMTARKRNSNSRKCKLDGCDDFHDAKGYCSRHYRKYSKHGDPFHIPVRVKREKKNKGPCVVAGCGKEGSRAGQMCYGHYMRNYRTGDPLGVADKKKIFIEKLLANPTSECVIWPFSMKDNGYGHHSYIDESGANIMVTAHRHMLSQLTGENPKSGLACHGPCHNRACVNPHPEHGMYWGDKKQNALDQKRDGTCLEGERGVMAKLSNRDVVDIRMRHSGGEPTRVIWSDYQHVHLDTLASVISLRSYKNV